MRKWTETELIADTQKGDTRALARLLSLLEERGIDLIANHPQLTNTSKSAFRLGVTGPPGAGKSSLINHLIKKFRESDIRVAVMAVDPSSPLTEGALLGDRIRYSDHFTDSGVFIRSLGSRGTAGGLSTAAWLMIRAFDLAEFDVVILETVGVGQTELEVMNLADETLVVLTPESGDGIQGMKAGLLEMAQTLIVHKCDRPGADLFRRELEAALDLAPNHQGKARANVFSVSSTKQDGLKEVFSHIEFKRNSQNWTSVRKNPIKLRAEARALLRAAFENEIQKRVSQIQTPDDLKRAIRKITETASAKIEG